jgi:hypothetical protein
MRQRKLYRAAVAGRWQRRGGQRREGGAPQVSAAARKGEPGPVGTLRGAGQAAGLPCMSGEWARLVSADSEVGELFRM